MLENVTHGDFATYGYIDLEENACNLPLPNTSRISNNPSVTHLDNLSFDVAPNPFTRQTTLSFELDVATTVNLGIYDLSGRLVKTLYQGPANAKEKYKFIFDGTNQAKGIYIARFVANGKVVHKKLMLTH